MKLRAYAYTNRGGRDHNEDALRASAEDGVFVLADGLGGHRCGEVASALAVDALFTGMVNSEHLDGDGLAELFRSANEEILRRQAQPGQEEMRTTAVALKIAGDAAVWAHIGDSRLYRFHGGEAAEVTADHSVTYRKFLGGEISYMDIYHDDDRGRLLRCWAKSPAGRRPVGPPRSRGTPFSCAPTDSGSMSTPRRCRRTCANRPHRRRGRSPCSCGTSGGRPRKTTISH